MCFEKLQVSVSDTAESRGKCCPHELLGITRPLGCLLHTCLGLRPWRLATLEELSCRRKEKKRSSPMFPLLRLLLVYTLQRDDKQNGFNIHQTTAVALR